MPNNLQTVLTDKLIFSDLGQYEVHNTYGTIFNLSLLLDKIYMSDNNHLRIKIMQGCKTLFEEDGLLLKRKIKNNFYSMHLSGLDLETELFNLVDESLEITIYTEALGANDYGQFCTYTEH